MAFAFEKLTASDVGLVCAAILLLFGASSLSALRSQDRFVRTLARSGYLTALSAGGSVAVLTSIIDVPEQVIALLLVALVVGTLVVRFRARSQRGAVFPPLGDVGMTAAFLGMFSATSALLALAAAQSS